MSVLVFDIYDRDDPNAASPLTTLTDADCIAMDFRVGLNQEGAGSFTISKHSALANRTDIPDNAYVKVTIPSVDTDPIFGFWADEFRAQIISANEQGGETITIGGPGIIDILRRAILFDVPYVPTQPARGSMDVIGKWHWINEPWGAVLTRGIEEGQVEPGDPLEHVTIDFDRVNDSDSVAWPTVSTIFEVTIGMDIHTLYRELVKAGGLYVIPHPDLLIQAFQTYGRDLNATVIFAKAGAGANPGNIITELVRTGRGTRGASVALVRGRDEVYATVNSGNYSPGHVIFVPYDETDEVTHLTSVGTEAINQSTLAQNAIEFEITPGFDPANGLYMPGPDGTSGHFWIGDSVTVDTGSDSDKWDDVEQDRIVTGIRVSLDEAADDTDSTTSARSLRVVVELDGMTQDPQTPVPAPRIQQLRSWLFDHCTESGRPSLALSPGIWHVHADVIAGATTPILSGTGSAFTINGEFTSFIVAAESDDVVVTADNKAYSLFADRLSDALQYTPPACGA